MAEIRSQHQTVTSQDFTAELQVVWAQELAWQLAPDFNTNAGNAGSAIELC